MPAHLAWILEEDRRVTIPVPNRGERNFNLVRPIFAEQEGTKGCRIHPRKRVLS